ncbi:MAG TPA: Lrp/AsnC family transcriptional regulator [Candidatus Obscuribacterales bacterium]
MEKNDQELLSILYRDARTSHDQIARMTGRKAEDVRADIERLEKSGIIKHYKTIVDWEKAGVEKVTAFINVKVTPARDVGFDDLARRVYRFSEVKSVYLVSGDADLRVVVEADTLRHLGQFVAEKLSTINGVIGTTTHFMLKKYKEDDDIFVDAEEDNRLVVTP